MRKLVVSYFANTTANECKPVSFEWPDEAIRGFTSPLKVSPEREQVPLVMAGANDGRRGDAHVLSRSMLVMDLDAKPEADESERAWTTRAGIFRKAFLTGLERLKTADTAFMWHTTHSHNDKTRLGWRVWLPLAEDVLPGPNGMDRWREANHAVNQAIFDGICDGTCYNLERLMRLPAVHPDRMEVFASGAFGNQQGQLIAYKDVLELWDLMPADQRFKKYGAKHQRRVPSAYTPVHEVESSRFGLPVELVNTLRLDCAQIAQGNDRLQLDTRLALESVAHAATLKKGHRDNGLIGLLGIFSNRFLNHEPRPLLAALLLPVLQRTHDDDPHDPIKPNIPDPIALCEWAVEQVEWRRTQARNPLGHTLVSDEESKHIRDWTNGERSGGMSEEELHVLAKLAGLTADELQAQLFVLFDKHTYVWMYNRYFPRPFHTRELTIGVARAVLAACGISRRYFDEDAQEFKPLKLADVMEKHGTHAAGIRASYLVKQTHFDHRDQHLVEAMGQRRHIEPKEHPQIHKWLELLGGEKLLDWVAALPQTDKANSILMLAMPRNAGKNLLAHGLSRLWQRGSPVDAKDALATSFNGELSESPFIFADEELPRLHGKSLGAELRQLVSNPDITIRRKFLPNVKCSGYVRLLIAANSDNPLKDFGQKGSQLTEADLHAIAERLLFIEASEAPVEYLATFDRAELDTWREQNKIAEHALWLAANRKIVSPGRRFLVEGNAERALFKLVVGDELTSQLLSWFITHALRANRATKSTDLQSGVSHGMFSQDGELWVTLDLITSTWESFRPSYRMASEEPFLAALETVSSGKAKVMRQGTSRHYWRVRSNYLEYYAERLGYGSEAVARAIMAKADPAAVFVDKKDTTESALPLQINSRAVKNTAIKEAQEQIDVDEREAAL